MNEPPRKPEESECCGQGCRTCVHDLYQQELTLYNKMKKSVKSDDDLILTSMSPELYTETILSRIEPLCSSVYIYHFKLPENFKLIFSAGQHLVLRENDVIRPYTLITSPGSVKEFGILVKLYENGVMSSLIRSRWTGPGVKVRFRGPLGADPEVLCNKFNWLFLIGAGTGIAPLFQLAKFVIDNEEDERRICLFYGCKSYEEVLLRPELQRMQGYWNFGVKYFLSRDDDVRVGKVKKHNEVVICSRMTEEDLQEKLVGMRRTGSVGIYVCGRKISRNVLKIGFLMMM